MTAPQPRVIAPADGGGTGGINRVLPPRYIAAVLDYAARVERLSIEDRLALLEKTTRTSSTELDLAQRLEIALLLGSLNGSQGQRQFASQLAALERRLSPGASDLSHRAQRLRRQLVAAQARETESTRLRAELADLKQRSAAERKAYEKARNASDRALEEALAKIRALTAIEEEIERTSPKDPTSQ